MIQIVHTSPRVFTATLRITPVAVGLILEEGDTWYRKILRSGRYCIDKSINGGVTWELNLVQLMPDEDTIIILIDNGVAGHRHLVRDGAYCIDMELTELGFDGVENTDWENIYNTNTI